MNKKIYYIFGHYSLTYGLDIWSGISSNYLLEERHSYDAFVGAISPEILHTIRIIEKMTFYYGFKMPYFYSFNKTKYDPKYSQDLLNRFELELALGIMIQLEKQ